VQTLVPSSWSAHPSAGARTRDGQFSAPVLTLPGGGRSPASWVRYAGICRASPGVVLASQSCANVDQALMLVMTGVGERCFLNLTKWLCFEELFIFFVWEEECNYSMSCISQVPRERRSSTAKPEVEHPDQDHSKRYHFLLLRLCLSAFPPRPPKLLKESNLLLQCSVVLEERNRLLFLCAPNSCAAPGKGWKLDLDVEI